MHYTYIMYCRITLSQLLTSFTRSLDLTDPLISPHEQLVALMPSSPRVTYLDNSSRYDRNDENDLVDLELTFPQFNALFAAGIISKTEMNMGRVKRSDLAAINEFLSQSQLEIERQEQEVALTVDCGLKRVDSKIYRRDYVINREPVGVATLQVILTISPWMITIENIWDVENA